MLVSWSSFRAAKTLILLLEYSQKRFGVSGGPGTPLMLPQDLYSRYWHYPWIRCQRGGATPAGNKCIVLFNILIPF